MSINLTELHLVNQALLAEVSSLKKQHDTLAQNSDFFFLIIMSLVVYFMQAGFAFLECGAVRSKNSTNILIKNVMDSFVGGIAYWLIGFPLAYGKGGPFIGATYWAHAGLPEDQMATWFFQFVFAAAASTIVSGAVAERCDFVGYITYSVFITGFVYPVVTHWAWTSEGWLSQGAEYCCECPGLPANETCNTTFTVGYQDFAGSGVVHLVGGICAVVGALLLGARRGRFVDGKPVPIPGHSVPLAALGGFILFFGFFAFNGGSRASISAENDGTVIAIVCVNTIIAGAGSALFCLLVSVTCSKQHHWSLLTTLNGGLTGMVAICASCDGVYTWGSLIIGVGAGACYLGVSSLVLRLKIDDPLDATAVHAGGGLWGVLAAPIFRRDGIIAEVSQRNLLRLAWNAAGAAAITVWSLGLSLLIFGLLKLTGLLRVKKEIEDKGLDIPKHGEPAYPLESYGHGWVDVDTKDMAILVTNGIPHKLQMPMVGSFQNGGKVSEGQYECGDVQVHAMAKVAADDYRIQHTEDDGKAESGGHDNHTFDSAQL